MRRECLWCKREIGEDWPTLQARCGEICMECEGTDVEVFVVTINQSSVGFKSRVDALEMLQDELESMGGDTISIRKQKMPIVEYYNMQEFQGV